MKDEVGSGFDRQFKRSLKVVTDIYKEEAIMQIMGVPRQPDTFNDLDVPPVDWIKQGYTDHQMNYFFRLRSNFAEILQYMKEWFGGVKGDRPIDMRGETMLALRDEYLALYALIYEAWELIKESWGDWEDAPTEPGELLIRLIELDALASLRLCEEEKRFMPRKEREALELKAKPQLSAFNQRRLDKLEREQDDSPGVAEALRLRRWVLNLCDRIAKSQSKKNARIKASMRQYRQTAAELDRIFNKNSHPNKGGRGWQWVDGSLHFLS